MELLLAYILIILPIFLFFYEVFIYWYATMPSVIHFARYRERRFAKGYDGDSIVMLSVLFIASIALIVWYLYVLLKNSNRSNLEMFNDIFLQLSFLLICTVSIYFLYHKYSINIFKLSFKKNTKNEDLLEPRVIMEFLNSSLSPTIVNNHNYYRQESARVTKKKNDIIRDLEDDQILDIIKNNEGVSLNKFSVSKLLDFMKGKEFEGKIVIEVEKHGEGQIQKKPAILFLEDLLYFKEFWNSREYKNTQIKQFINKLEKTVKMTTIFRFKMTTIFGAK